MKFELTQKCKGKEFKWELDFYIDGKKTDQTGVIIGGNTTSITTADFFKMAFKQLEFDSLLKLKELGYVTEIKEEKNEKD